jgi:hypothetical protein
MTDNLSSAHLRAMYEQQIRGGVLASAANIIFKSVVHLAYVTLLSFGLALAGDFAALQFYIWAHMLFQAALCLDALTECRKTWILRKKHGDIDLDIFDMRRRLMHEDDEAAHTLLSSGVPRWLYSPALLEITKTVADTAGTLRALFGMLLVLYVPMQCVVELMDFVFDAVTLFRKNAGALGRQTMAAFYRFELRKPGETHFEFEQRLAAADCVAQEIVAYVFPSVLREIHLLFENLFSAALAVSLGLLALAPERNVGMSVAVFGYAYALCRSDPLSKYRDPQILVDTFAAEFRHLPLEWNSYTVQEKVSFVNQIYVLEFFERLRLVVATLALPFVVFFWPNRSWYQ